MGKKLAKALDLPEQAFGQCRVTVCGQERLWVENHRGLLEYGQTRIRFARQQGELAIIGKDLSLEQSGLGQAQVCGRIFALSYSGGHGDAQ